MTDEHDQGFGRGGGQLGLTIRADRSVAEWRELVTAAEAAGISFLIIEPGVGNSQLDPLLVASYLAPLTSRLAVVPTVQVTHLEPFHISKALATIDHLSAWRGPGRAGWVVEVDLSSQGAELDWAPPGTRGRPSVAGGR